MASDLKGTIIRAAICLVAYFAVFAFAGALLSHHLFLFGDFALSPAQSQSALWVMYAAFACLLAILFFVLSPNPIEALALGALMGAGAGGLYVIGYTMPLIVVVVAVVAGVVVFALKGGVIRAVYIGISAGLTLSLLLFCMSALSMSHVRGLSYASTTSDSITNDQWAEMSATQRESFIAGVIQSEASRLDIGSVDATQAILPKEVLATVDENGTLLVNYAALRVASPSPASVASYERTNDVEWVYEALTSPEELTTAVIHSTAHVYQSQRVKGQISAQRTWPYDDAEDDTGKCEVIEEWTKYLPVDPRTDVESGDNKLESQAWGYASNRVGAYLE